NTSVNDTWQTYANNALKAPEDEISPFSPYYTKSQTHIDLYPFLFVLPDGKLFIVGGNTTGKADDGRGASLPPVDDDPAKNTWTFLAYTR
ncbi:kelch repeat-containing protein, partial [Burkholderia pseudomallei]